MVWTVIADIAYYLVTEVGTTWFVGYVIAAVVVYEGLTLIGKALAPSGKSGQGGSQLLANYANTEAGAPIIYGQIRCGGMETIPPITTGTNGEFLNKVLTHAGHQCYAVTDIYFNTNAIPTATIAAVTGVTGDGLVTSGTYVNVAWLRRYTGAQTQADWKLSSEVDFVAFASAAFIGRGMTYTAVTLKYNSKVWQATGVPSVSALVDGALDYDPRLDSTNGGSGSMRYATPSTWLTYTTSAVRANPALCFANYLMVWGGYDPATEIDWSSVTAAANVCDALVANAAGGTAPRYTCNGMLLANNGFIDNLKLLADAMLGKFTFTDGIWRMYAGGWTAPTITINESDWISPLQVQLDGGRDTKYNRVRAWYIEPTQTWGRIECFPRANATYQAADGAEWIDQQIDQPFCINENECQRKAEFVLRASRNQIMVTGRLGPKWQNGIQMMTTATVNHALFGWTSKTFRIVSVSINPDSSVDVALREEQSTDWTDLLNTDYGAPSIASLPAQNQPSATQPGALTVNELVNGTIACNWSRSVVEPVNTVYQILRAPAAYPTSPQGVIWEGDAVTAYVPSSANDIGKLSYYWVVARTNSYFSDTNPSSGSQGVPMLLLQRADNTYSNQIVPDPNFSVGTPVYWNVSSPGNLPVSQFDDGTVEVVATLGGTITYVASGGPVSGYVSMVGSTNNAFSPTAAMQIKNHPNMINSIGYPIDFGRGAYRTDIKYRVNSCTAPALYARAALQRVALPSSAVYAPPTVLDVALVSSPGNGWLNASIYSFLQPISVGSPDNAAYLLPTIGLYTGLTNRFNVDIGQVYITRLSPANYPWSDYANVSLVDHNTDQSRRVIVPGSATYRVSTYQLPGWAVGEYITLAKTSSSFPAVIWHQNSAMSFVLQNSHSNVQTLTMAGAATVAAKITRVSSTQFNVEGYGLT